MSKLSRKRNARRGTKVSQKEMGGGEGKVNRCFHFLWLRLFASLKMWQKLTSKTAGHNQKEIVMNSLSSR